MGYRRRIFIFLFFLFIAAFPSAAGAAQGDIRVEIRDNKFYVDGEPFFVKGIGYYALRPHQKPQASYAGVNYHLTDLDFKRIKAAHFNTIRTWDALVPEELDLAKSYGLMVLQGIWLDPKQDFSDLRNADSCVAHVQAIAKYSREHDNVLGYVLMTEPTVEAVLDSGVQETQYFFRRLKRAIQVVDPRPVSMDSWLPLAFLDYDNWDFITFNTFAFAPKSVNHALGYPGYNRWLVERFAKNKPFIVGETGGYAVSKATWSVFGGAGGLSEYDQSLKDLDSLRGTVEGHAWGACLVNWVDPWHYPKDPDVHDDEPWEWDGVLGIPTDSSRDIEGIPRQVYRDLVRYNQAILVEPKEDHIYPNLERIPIRLYASPNVQLAEYSLNDSDWKPLDGSGRGWWVGSFQLPSLARKRQRLAVRVQDHDHTITTEKSISFLAAVLPEKVTIEPAEKTKSEKRLSFVVRVLDGQGEAIAGRKVYFGFFFPIGWRESMGTQVTDAAGKTTISCSVTPSERERFVFVSAGTDSPERVRTGDMRIFAIRPSR